MTAQAVGADFGMEEPFDPTLHAARCLAREWLAAAHWEQPLPALTRAAADQVHQLRREALEQREALGSKRREQHERDRARDLAAQRERERRMRAEELRR